MIIKSNTTLKSIKKMVMNDFDVIITNAQAKEIRDSIRHGVALWTKERYISTCPTDDILRLGGKSVRGLGNAGYLRKEWNDEHRAIALNEAKRQKIEWLYS